MDMTHSSLDHALAAGARPLVLAVVLPTYNERPNIAPMVARLEQALGSSGWEAIFVDDDSTDGTADEARSAIMTHLPPKRSAAMPAGSRQRAPLRIATEVSHANWPSSSPNSSRMGTPSTPNISQTANRSVKLTVASHSTREEAAEETG